MKAALLITVWVTALVMAVGWVAALVLVAATAAGVGVIVAVDNAQTRRDLEAIDRIKERLR